jgi:hypothetical protein
MYDLLTDLSNYPDTLSCFIFGEYLHLLLRDDTEKTRAELLKHLQSNGYKNIEMDRIRPTIEDCFIKLLKN